MTEWLQPEQTLEFRAWPYEPYVGRFFAGSISAVDVHRGKLYAYGADLSPAGYLRGKPWERAGAEGYHVAYPPLREGDIVPVGRGIYRVEEVSSTRVTLRLTLLDPKDVPAGVSLGRNSYVYPLYEPVASDGRAMSVSDAKLHDCYLNVSWILRPRLNPDVPVAVIDTCVPMHPERGAWKGYKIMRPQTVRAGDILKIGDFRHRVRNIVPPDPEHQVIGWVELDPDPLPDEPEQKH